MRTVIRHITCSSDRAKRFCATLPPESIRWEQPVCHGHPIPMTAGYIASQDGYIDAELRYIDEPIDLDSLSELAQDMARHDPRNHVHDEYRIVVTRSVADISGWDKTTRLSEHSDAPYTTNFHWPCLRDGESGNEYYERCAKLVTLYRALLDGGIPLARVRLIAAQAEQWKRPWTVDGVLTAERERSN